MDGSGPVPFPEEQLRYQIGAQKEEQADAKASGVTDDQLPVSNAKVTLRGPEGVGEKNAETREEAQDIQLRTIKPSANRPFGLGHKRHGQRTLSTPGLSTTLDRIRHDHDLARDGKAEKEWD